ncbi:HrpJ domain-containing protein [Thermoflexus sp.]|uniref:HrpJ domain-containing protein n=1 Tax=Thermoflexus sp. TaxID=1969742 RepID=UPI0025F6D55E|nr:HrpJ domain-containing protein [Thermoflexus sp.]MDW8181600.1 HrpJ domain-containing protein [Anaerolineae bacterium]MCS6963135.1 hypothetical protein [Thermoflexus sp.]MCS7352139.1 hypothetical protein [Thermoflexus sp.]MCX7690467.1 hypothetical protein [Thermoflexus sp.]MDW8185962.1 HrpJ domain-containing protein [Anaerolineae bacterium]
MSTSESAIPPEGIQRLLERLTDLSEDERALLLALTQLDQEIGRSLSPEEQQLLQRLAASLESYDPEEIRTAIRRMVQSRPQRPAEPWPGDLRRRLRRRLRSR